MGNEIFRTKKWGCRVEEKGTSREHIGCESKNADLLSIWNDRSIRFSKGGKNCSVKVDGNILKNKEGDELCGVELN